ncbi:C4-dicarboxylate ABC transporter permease [Halarcobacter mediterraneus]|uniref:C4-dicarboxylate ABC transporter permease n=1 Tax=Halarcobacter mediterraneus TaxID=2023153 RepID=A0A4Q1AW46_9BACT|nr:TRAP transporter small permease [Halarcobacter mediterraneus]RXK12202.1 C4-dicarboxylate ABC transporter permease [Halarcobacter mediterraneus]
MIENFKKGSEFIVYLCGILLFSSVLLISTEVFLRKFFLVSFGGVDEISGYILGISISWSLAYVLFEKMHIRVDILYTKASKIVKSSLDSIAMFFTLLFSIFLTYFTGNVFLTSLEKNSLANTPLATPLWIPQSVWFLGFLFFSFLTLIMFIKAIKALIENRIDKDVSVKKEF